MSHSGKHWVHDTSEQRKDAERKSKRDYQRKARQNNPNLDAERRSATRTRNLSESAQAAYAIYAAGPIPAGALDGFSAAARAEAYAYWNDRHLDASGMDEEDKAAWEKSRDNERKKARNRAKQDPSPVTAKILGQRDGYKCKFADYSIDDQITFVFFFDALPPEMRKVFPFYEDMCGEYNRLVRQGRPAAPQQPAPSVASYAPSANVAPLALGGGSTGSYPGSTGVGASTSTITDPEPQAYGVVDRRRPSAPRIVPVTRTPLPSGALDALVKGRGHGVDVSQFFESEERATEQSGRLGTQLMSDVLGGGGGLSTTHDYQGKGIATASSTHTTYKSEPPSGSHQQYGGYDTGSGASTHNRHPQHQQHHSSSHSSHHRPHHPSSTHGKRKAPSNSPEHDDDRAPPGAPTPTPALITAKAATPLGYLLSWDPFFMDGQGQYFYTDPKQPGGKGLCNFSFTDEKAKNPAGYVLDPNNPQSGEYVYFYCRTGSGPPGFFTRTERREGKKKKIDMYRLPGMDQVAEGW